jgi:hypothetical protein
MKYVFVNGRLAIQIRWWEEPDFDDGGCRVELRRVSQVEGVSHRPGAAGATIGPVAPDGLWRADLFMDLAQPGRGCFHFHPHFANSDVGERIFPPAMQQDPRQWIEEQLSDLPKLLRECGAADLLASVDLAEHRRGLPLMLSAVDLCLARVAPELARRVQAATA